MGCVHGSVEGRELNPYPPQARTGVQVVSPTGKKKKKARRGQIPAGIQQHPDTSSSVDAPEIPVCHGGGSGGIAAAARGEAEVLSKGAGYILSSECVPRSQALNTRGRWGVSTGDLGEDCTVCTHVLLCIL